MLLLVLAGAAPALQAQSPPKIHYACYVPLTGTVYKIKEVNTKPACSTGHVEFSWMDGLNALRTGDAAGGDLLGTYPNPSVKKLMGEGIAPLRPNVGDVLTYSSMGEWTPLPAPSGGVTDHGALSGLAHDDHPQYVLADGVRSTVNGFAVTGTYGVGTIPVDNVSGTRMMWHPAKAAFRVGKTDIYHWRDTQVGSYSFAAGNNSMASGAESAAFGEAHAEGAKSFAIGTSAANGDYSVAMGALADARQSYAIALGNNAFADGQNAVAIGQYAKAWAQEAIAIGSGTKADADNSIAIGHMANTNGHTGSIVIADNSSTYFAPSSTDNQFAVRAQHVWFGTDYPSNTAGHYIDTGTGAYLTTGGTWTDHSSRDAKENFTEVEPDAVLGKIAALPVSQWNYKVEPATTRHIGPVAQDFHAAFGVGNDAEHIAALDVGGVSLLGIQALEKRTRELERENAQLKGRLERLEAALARLGVDR